MFRVAVTGGKGGTGKTFVAVNIASLLARRHQVVLADLDIEAPNDHILLGVDELGEGEDIKLFLPFIDTSRCTSCGVCAKVCDAGALLMPGKSPPLVLPRLCSGCMACYYACPYKAIIPGYHVLGHIHINKVHKGDSSLTLVTGILREGEEHIAPGVYRVKMRALSLQTEVLVIDTGPGTGNHISIALKDSDVVIVVTEPTPLGRHDMEAILKIVKNLGLRTWLVINRDGIGNAEESIKIASSYGVKNIFRIPYHRDAIESYYARVPVIALKPESPVSKIFLQMAGLLEEVMAQ
ncbi:cobalamin biosynthesis protein CobQ [Infirmifilum uzonense]|uniref:Cobalamin biosynthesis protein CobQ n=1 Tax=Infirmifilum uzonense TaxID=1550241 RepID=A0A0F7CKW4_9CREN|nr:P-loop NTPase [Infirmifilum uzonense]AKG38366.1 cobalamin biosynthesis protein CobQ [Infirmifilum uzonense]